MQRRAANQAPASVIDTQHIKACQKQVGLFLSSLFKHKFNFGQTAKGRLMPHLWIFVAFLFLGLLASCVMVV